MAKVHFAPLARRDLIDILEYIARDKPEAAHAWIERIREKCQLLAQNPQIGTKRPEFRTGEFRSSLVGHYVIFYRQANEGIEVARVVRGERDITSL